MRAAISGARTISYLSGCTPVTADVGVVLVRRWGGEFQTCQGVTSNSRRRRGRRSGSPLAFMTNNFTVFFLCNVNYASMTITLVRFLFVYVASVSTLLLLQRPQQARRRGRIKLGCLASVAG